MCWMNSMVIPIVLKKPLKVYKIGTSTNLGNFISLYQNFMYRKFQTMPTIKINPRFIRISNSLSLDALWDCDSFYINEGYHSYLTEEVARWNSEEFDAIGIFEIPAGATIYVNYICQEVVSTDIKYLGLLE